MHPTAQSPPLRIDDPAFVIPESIPSLRSPHLSPLRSIVHPYTPTPPHPHTPTPPQAIIIINPHKIRMSPLLEWHEADHLEVKHREIIEDWKR